MLRVDKNKKTMVVLPTTKMSDEGWLERHLQDLIVNSADDFAKEIGKPLMIIGKEVSPSGEIPDRIDLLAIDSGGAAVIIELKRDENKLQLLQSITYASMVATWKLDQFVKCLMSFRGISEDDARQQLSAFLEEDGLEHINEDQSVILMAEAFDYCILATAKWLQEKYGVDISCIRVELAASEDAQLLTCSQIFPTREIAEQAEPRRIRSGTSHVYTTWEEVLERAQNKAVRDFFLSERDRGGENRLKTDPHFRYRVNGKQRWSVVPRQKHASVWQSGRFENDIEYWTQRLGKDAEVRPVDSEQSLAFNLSRAAQFETFRSEVTGHLQKVNFVE